MQLKIRHHNAGHRSVFTIYAQLDSYDERGAVDALRAVGKAAKNALQWVNAQAITNALPNPPKETASFNAPYLRANAGRIIATSEVHCLVLDPGSMHVSDWARELSRSLDALMPTLCTNLNAKMAR